MKYEPRKVGRVTVSFDVIQIGGDFWHLLEEITTEIVEDSIMHTTVWLHAEDGQNKKIIGDESKYDVDNVTIDKLEPQGDSLLQWRGKWVRE